MLAFIRPSKRKWAYFMAQLREYELLPPARVRPDKYDGNEQAIAKHLDDLTYDDLTTKQLSAIHGLLFHAYEAGFTNGRDPDYER